MKKISQATPTAEIELEFDMPAADVLAEKCPSRELLRHVTGRWGLLVFWALRDKKKHRFSELRRTITGVSEKMLAQTLQHLEHDGFVQRIAHPVVPPHVEYQLTPLGADFAKQVSGLMRWIEKNLTQVLDARARTLTRDD